MFEGLGPVIACVLEYFAPLVKIRSITIHRNISKSSYTNKYNKNTKNLLYDVVMLHKYCYAVVIHPNTSLYKEIKHTLVAMHGTLELKHKHTKLLFLKAMLHPAPQIKLWGGVGLKIIRENHILKNTPHQKVFSKTICMLTLHNTIPQKIVELKTINMYGLVKTIKTIEKIHVKSLYKCWVHKSITTEGRTLHKQLVSINKS